MNKIGISRIKCKTGLRDRAIKSMTNLIINVIKSSRIRKTNNDVVMRLL